MPLNFALGSSEVILIPQSTMVTGQRQKSVGRTDASEFSSEKVVLFPHLLSAAKHRQWQHGSS